MQWKLTINKMYFSLYRQTCPNWQIYMMWDVWERSHILACSFINQIAQLAEPRTLKTSFWDHAPCYYMYILYNAKLLLVLANFSYDNIMESTQISFRYIHAKPYVSLIHQEPQYIISDWVNVRWYWYAKNGTFWQWLMFIRY